MKLLVAALMVGLLVLVACKGPEPLSPQATPTPAATAQATPTPGATTEVDSEMENIDDIIEEIDSEDYNTLENDLGELENW